ncbi:MAG: hydantoinase B/oxoprolinase family protein [Pseudomonadales bacterium]|jgi:N-methylhydantoinase B|nr:hydantoinase B/oxoprolinase family protein [Pseudomonadales bacterium]
MQELQIQLAWNRLLAIVEEQAQVLMRTAFSTVVREAGDLSAGVFNPAGDMLAQAVTGTPGHVNSMAAAVAKFLDKFPLATLQPGDVLLTNDPWDGTGHLNDFTVVTPVFSAQGCVALFASTSHIADVGGRGFGPDANDVFEEGLRIPISHLFRAGIRNDVLMDILLANVRDPLVAQGDLYSLTACNDAGAAALLDMMQDLSLPDLDELGATIIQRSDDAMREQIARLPQGRYAYAMTVDGYDEPVEIKAEMHIDGRQITVDFAGSSGASPRGINVPLAYTQAYASFGVRCLVGNEIPNNAGSLAAIHVRAPQDTLLNARSPRAVSARHSIGQMLPDVVLGCLAQVLPESVPAEGASCIWNPVFMHALGAADDQQFVINPIFNGGTGARPHKDGLSTTAFPSGVRTTSTEVNEVTSPLLFWCKEYTPGSGGEGRFRGGLGQTIRVSHRYAQPFVISKMFDRIVHPARGRARGLDGGPGAVTVEHADGTLQSLAGKGREQVPAQATLVLKTPGGGGFGPAEKRKRQAELADQLAGLVNKADNH